jgi:hypothetical protein
VIQLATGRKGNAQPMLTYPESDRHPAITPVKRIPAQNSIVQFALLPLVLSQYQHR